MKITKHTVRALLIALCLLPLHTLTAAESGGVEDSYHGQMGYETGDGLGMLEKWCALPNFSFDQQDGIDGWTKMPCNGCHIGAAWNPTKTSPVCEECHTPGMPKAESVTMERCMTCHLKDTAKRGDLFTVEQDVHIAMGMVCQDCHLRVDDGFSDHQLLKGTAMDTTEPTLKGTLSCTTACHDEEPHDKSGKKSLTLNTHTRKVACETCHTGLRPAMALESRKWNVFSDGKPVTTKHAVGWLPEHKWYDNTGPGASGDYHLPILSHTERRDIEGAKIYPFNAVTVDWYVKDDESGFDDVIIVPEVKAADADGDGTVTLDEMQAGKYPKANLMTADMNFSISHSVTPAKQAFDCNDCHGQNGWVLDWNELGYAKDPLRKLGKGHKNK